MSASGWHVEGPSGPADCKGRRVIADRLFRAGEVVLHDDAYSSVVISEQLQHVCSCGCLQPLSQPLRCSACKLACFASREHQRRGWQAGGHRQECAALRTAAPRVPPTAVRLALRCVLRNWQEATAVAQDGTVGPAAGKDPRYAELLGLQQHWELLQDGTKLQFAQIGALAHSLLATAAPAAADAVTPRDLAHLVARFGCNSHTISDAELQPLAVGIFPLGAMVNHDCRPNTVHSFAGSRMLFRAVRDIQPGEEVTTSYTELAAPRWERRAALLQHHLFDIDAPPLAAAAGAAGAEAAAPAAEAGAAAAAAVAEAPAAEAAEGAGARGRSQQLGQEERQQSQRQQQQQQAHVQAALQCLPALPAAAPLPLPAAEGELRLYDSCLPPWPHDKRDAALTEVVELAPAGGSSNGSSSKGSSGSSGGGSGSRSWGGMWACAPGAGAPGAGASGVAGAGESFGLDGYEELVEAAVADAKGAAEGSSGSSGSGSGSGSGEGPSRGCLSAGSSQGESPAGAGAAAAAAAASGAVGQAGQPQQPLVVHCWRAGGKQAQQAEQEQQQQAALSLAARYAVALRLQQAVDGSIASGGAAEAMQQLQHALAALCGGTECGAAGSASLALGPRHVLRMRLLAELHRAAIAAGEWEAALAAARQLLPLYQQAYQPAWPQLGLLWASIAKLEHLVENSPSRALEAATAALRILGITHGGSGAAAEEMRRVAYEAEAELRQGQGALGAGRLPSGDVEDVDD